MYHLNFKGTEPRGSTLKSGPLNDPIIVDGKDGHAEGNSSFSDKEKWQEINYRKRKTQCEQGEVEKEIIAEPEGLPTKKIATTKAVADAINKGFKKAAWKGEEMKAPSPMEEVPQAPPKWPKMQTAALVTLKGKEKPKKGEAGEGLGTLLKRSIFNQEIPEDVLNVGLRQANGLYSTLVERMSKDRDWADGLWNLRERLVMVAIYGAKTWNCWRESSP